MTSPCLRGWGLSPFMGLPLSHVPFFGPYVLYVEPPSLRIYGEVVAADVFSHVFRYSELYEELSAEDCLWCVYLHHVVVG